MHFSFVCVNSKSRNFHLQSLSTKLLAVSFVLLIRLHFLVINLSYTPLTGFFNCACRYLIVHTSNTSTRRVTALYSVYFYLTTVDCHFLVAYLLF